MATSMTNKARMVKSGAAGDSVPPGTSVSSPKADDISVAVISMVTVAETVGVSILRKAVSGSRNAMKTRVASSESAPLDTAVTPTPTTASAVPMTATYPEPKHRIGTACIIVVRPQMAIAAKAIYGMRPRCRRPLAQ